MKNGVEDFVVESTPVLDLKKNGLTPVAQSGAANADVNWDSDRTEVYSDGDADSAVASLVGEHGEVFPITTFPFVIGRGSECDLVLQGKGVSRRHAEIIFQAGRFVVNDLESLNGIKVNGYKVARVILEEKDSIKLGEVNLVFQSGGAAAENQGVVAAAESPKKFGIFGGGKNKPGSKQVEVKDDTFGPSPIKKIAVNLAILISFALVAMVGYQLWISKQQPAGIIVQSATQSEKAPQNRVEKAVPAAGDTSTSPHAVERDKAPASNNVVVESHPESVSVDPPPSISPPPSIAKVSIPAPVPVDEPEKIKQVPVIPPTKPIVTVKPAAQKTVSASRPVPKFDVPAKLREARDYYLAGDAERALATLKPVQQSSGLSASDSREVTASVNNFSTLYDLYISGQNAFNQGKKEAAFQSWVNFMNMESSLLKGQKSVYSQSISTRVINEYVDIGNEAAKSGDNHKAYRMWQKALELGDSVAARIAIDNANNRAMQIYRQALRLEYVNTSKAKAMWHEVTDLVPPGTEYNTKASAKLAWYEKWGS